MAGRGRDFMQIKVRQRDHISIKLNKDLAVLGEMADRRRVIAQVMLTYLENKVPDGMKGATLHLEVTLGELGDALSSDITIATLYSDAVREMAAVNAAHDARPDECKKSVRAAKMRPPKISQ